MPSWTGDPGHSAPSRGLSRRPQPPHPWGRQAKPKGSGQVWALLPGSLTAGPHLLQVKLHRALLCLSHVLLHKQDSCSQGKPAGPCLG